jgi:hypothetical protein
MADFDPYHRWLGIAKGQRPPNHYQLLGVPVGEADLEVIEEAAVRQSAHVRTYQIGQHAADCARILNEIALAKTVLLNPKFCRKPVCRKPSRHGLPDPRPPSGRSAERQPR